MKVNLPVTQREIFFSPGQYLVSKTDLTDIITQANRAFVETAYQLHARKLMDL